MYDHTTKKHAIITLPRDVHVYDNLSSDNYHKRVKVNQ